MGKGDLELVSMRRRKQMVAVTSSGTAVVTLPTETQILITREFDAPKHLISKAWTTAEAPRRCQRLRQGGWHAGCDGPARAGGGFAQLTAPHRHGPPGPSPRRSALKVVEDDGPSPFAFGD